MTTLAPTCVRRAWLTLGASTLALDNPAGGWFCSSLDLGPPAIREVVYNLPDTDGTADMTQYFAGRVVSANITAVRGAGASIDTVLASFAQYMVPSARPVLHYVLDRAGSPERTLTLRGATTGYAGPLVGPYQRDIQLQWYAADPIARDPATKSAYAWSGSTIGSGRSYPLVFPRVYPSGGGAQVNATIQTPGDVAVKPKVSIYGPITTPQATIALQVAGTQYALYFVAGFAIAAGHRVDIDTANHSAFMDGDPTQSVLNQIDWRYFNIAGYVPGWPVVPPVPESATLSLSGSSTSSSTQAIATWNDGFLT